MKKYYVKPELLNNEIEAECLLLVPSVNDAPANDGPVLSKEKAPAEEAEYGDLW